MINSLNSETLLKQKVGYNKHFVSGNIAMITRISPEIAICIYSLIEKIFTYFKVSVVHFSIFRRRCTCIV